MPSDNQTNRPKRARRDLNPRHPEPESGALSTELRALTLSYTTITFSCQIGNREIIIFPRGLYLVIVC